MIELWECSEPGCEALIDVSYRAVWEKKVGVYCRWHKQTQETLNRKLAEPLRKTVSHVSGRVGNCFYCGYEEQLTRDHVMPKSKGKQFKRPWNTVWACEFCNRKKADKTLAVWVREISRYRSHHDKYDRVFLRSTGFVKHLLTDPSHEELQRYRIHIDPELEFGRLE